MTKAELLKTNDLMLTLAHLEVLLSVFEDTTKVEVVKTWANERKVTLSLGDLVIREYEIEVGFGNGAHPLIAAAKIVKDWMEATE